MNFRSQQPYPEVKVQEKNPDYARMMLGNIGAQNSEMSAVGFYFYNHLITHARSVEVSDIYHQISLIEMHHLEIFGELSILLGADPRMWQCRNNRFCYWSASYLPYTMGMRNILETSLESEKEAVATYESQSRIIRDPDIVAILQRIIQDEEVHIHIFEELLAQYTT